MIILYFPGEQVSQFMIGVAQGDVGDSDRRGHTESSFVIDLKIMAPSEVRQAEMPSRYDHLCLHLIKPYCNCAPAGSTGIRAPTLLPYLLPPPIHKDGRRTIRTTVHESLKSFINIKPVSN